jgi:hypothetical protein
VVYIGFDAFADVIEAVESGTADYAMLPIENTTSGGINEVYDLLMHTPLSVIGEETVAIDHCLLGHPGSRVEALVRVYAHPQGFAQCSRYRQPGCKPLPAGVAGDGRGGAACGGGYRNTARPRSPSTQAGELVRARAPA